MDSKKLKGLADTRTVSRMGADARKNAGAGTSGLAAQGKATQRNLANNAQDKKLIGQYGKNAPRSRALMTDRSDAQPAAPRTKAKPKGMK